MLEYYSCPDEVILPDAVRHQLSLSLSRPGRLYGCAIWAIGALWMVYMLHCKLAFMLPFKKRILTYNNLIIAFRVGINYHTYEVIKDYPFVGIGFGMETFKKAIDLRNMYYRSQIKKGKVIVVYCQSGRRAAGRLGPPAPPVCSAGAGRKNRTVAGPAEPI